jgi:anaerobic ribonucleoside-triphosphate reductase activating protein
MNLAAIQFPTFNPYQKSTVELYISGCTHKCKNCHNTELRDFNYGKKLNIPELLCYLNERQHLFSIISITGGDLLSQLDHQECEIFCR